MKKITYIIFILFVTISKLLAQPIFNNAFQIGGVNDEDEVYQVKYDGSGNMYVAGKFSGTADFDPGPGVSSLTTSSISDGYLAKYSSAGIFQWVIPIAGTGGDIATAIGFDNTGNIILGGSFNSIVDFDPGAGMTSLNAGSGADLFLAKYDVFGNYIWAVNMPGTSSVCGFNKIMVDGSDNIYTAGYFQGVIDFDPSPATMNIGTSGIVQGFLAKYNSSLTPVFVKTMSGGGTSSNNAADFCMDATGNIYVTGHFGNTMNLGGSNLVASSPPASDVFLVKYNNSGTHLFSFNIGNTNEDRGAGIVLDNTNNIIITGYFTGTVDFNPSAFTNQLFSTTPDMFLAKYSNTGTYISCASMGGPQQDTPQKLLIDASNNLYVGGIFRNTPDFDPGAGIANITSNGDYDVFVAKYSSSFTYQWASGIGGSGTDFLRAMERNSSGNIIIGGSFANTVDFDPGAGTFNLTAQGPIDGFVTLLSECSAAPAQPGAITGANTVCQNSINTYSITAVPGATSYTWTLPSGWTGTSTTTSINTTAGSSGGNISVVANSGCGSSSPQVLAINVNSLPTVTANATSTSLCNGNNTTLNAGGANTYIWNPGSIGGGSINVSPIVNTTYTVTGTDVNTCTNTATVTITVNNIPMTPGSISGNSSVCSGSNNTYSVTSVPGATSYTWTLPGGWTGTSITNTINTTASSTSGNIIVTANNSCGSSAPQTLAINVNTSPGTPGTISGSTSMCSGSNNTYSVTNDPSATSYTWTLPGGWTGTSITNTINTTASTASGNISVTANNSCGNSIPQTLAVTVNLTPSTPGTISGLTTICSGSNNTYSVTAVPGATSYTWTLPGGWTGTSATNSINTTASSTSGNITVVANNGCGSSSPQILAITVNTSPSTPGTISGSTTICSGSSNTYSITAVPGATSYTWTLPGGWIGTSTTNSINTTASSTSGNITVVANNGCGSSSPQILAITVNTVPTNPGSISGMPIVCIGTYNTYSVVAVPGATSYNWTFPISWSGSSTTNSISILSGNTGGFITVSASNVCGTSSSNTFPVNVTTVPSGPGSISGNISICSGTTNTYSISSVPGATNYTWLLPSGWSGTSTTTSINATSNGTSGNIQVIPSNSCGPSSGSTLAVTVNSIPAVPESIIGSTNVCAGGNNTYSVTNDPSASSYTWTLPGGWTGTSTTNTINTTASSNGGNITVTANNTCGNSSPQILAVTVNTTPSTPGTISGSTTICSGSSNTYSVTNDPSASSYTWTLPGGWTGTSTTNTINTTASNVSGNITVTANNICGSSPTQSLPITVNVTPSIPGGISGNTSICSGSSNTYSVTNDPSATSYTWTLPGGWTGTSITNSITITAGSSGGTISVIANNVCGSSSAQTLPVSVNTIPSIPGIISGSTNICAGTTGMYSVVNDPSATSYTWTLPGSWTGTSTSNFINATASVAGGNITVTADNSCGSSSAQTLAVTVNSNPLTPSVISGSTNICSGSSDTYSVINDPSATSYTWTLPGGWTGTSATNTINATASATSGNIIVTANNTCGSSSPQTLTVTVNTTPAIPGTISGSTNICSGGSNTYSVTNDPSATSYTWTLPSGWTGTSATNTINTTASATSGNISVTANNSCGNSIPQTLAITVNSTPSTPGTISGLTTICSGSNNTYSVTAVPGATSYTWTLPGGWTGTSTTNSINTTASGTGGNVSVTANNSCGNSSPQTLGITVNPSPNVIANAADTNLCVGDPTTLTGNGAASYMWSGSVINGVPFNPTATSTYTVTGTDVNTCSSTATITITVNNLPVVSFNYSGPDTVCSYHGIQLLNGGSPSGGVYSGLGVTGNTFDPGIVDIVTNIITYTYTDANNCTNEDSTIITILDCLGMENNNLLTLTIYPNPFTNIITVAGFEGEQHIIIYNTLGEIVVNKIISKNSNVIELFNLRKGIYFLSVGTVTKTIIKQ